MITTLVGSVEKGDSIYIEGLCKFLTVIDIRNFAGRIIFNTQYKGGTRKFSYQRTDTIEIVKPL